MSTAVQDFLRLDQTRRPDRAEVLAGVDLRALFEANGLAQGRNRQWPCPSPQHAQTGRTPPVSISERDGHEVWCCHGCDVKGGTAVDFLMTLHGITVAEAFEQLTGGPQTSVPARRPAAAPRPPAPLDPDAGRLDGPEGEDVLGRYLAGRGWTAEAAEAFGLYAVRNAAQGHAVRHPYRAAGGVRWYQDRAVSDRGPKWWNPDGHQRIPHALDLATTMQWALDTEPPSLFVVEGPADVIALWHAAPGAACIGVPGTEGVKQWAPHLKGVDVLIVTDPDQAGDRAAEELARALHAAGGRSARLRPPVDLDDWRRQVGNQGLADGLQALADEAGWWIS